MCDCLASGRHLMRRYPGGIWVGTTLGLEYLSGVLHASPLKLKRRFIAHVIQHSKQQRTLGYGTANGILAARHSLCIGGHSPFLSRGGWFRVSQKDTFVALGPALPCPALYCPAEDRL